jgi:hypothetical protein
MGLLTNIDKIDPYSKNTMVMMQNTADFLFQMGANGDDPIARYAFVDDKIENGMFAWIRFGINQAASKNVNPAAFMTADGGVMNPTGPISQLTGGGGGGFGGFGGGGFGGGFGGGRGGRKKRAAEEEAAKDGK